MGSGRVQLLRDPFLVTRLQIPEVRDIVFYLLVINQLMMHFAQQQQVWVFVRPFVGEIRFIARTTGDGRYDVTLVSNDRLIIDISPRLDQLTPAHGAPTTRTSPK